MLCRVLLKRQFWVLTETVFCWPKNSSSQNLITCKASAMWNYSLFFDVFLWDSNDYHPHPYVVCADKSKSAIQMDCLAIGGCWVNFNLGCLHNAIQLSELFKKILKTYKGELSHVWAKCSKSNLNKIMFWLKHNLLVIYIYIYILLTIHIFYYYEFIIKILPSLGGCLTLFSVWCFTLWLPPNL